MQFSLNQKQQDTIDFLIRKLKNKNTPNESPNNEFRAYTNGIDEKEITILQKVFQEYLVGEKIYVGMVLVALSPWRIHTDYTKGDSNPAKAILIPWQTLNASTIIFNEMAKNNSDILNMKIKKSHVSRDFYQKNMEHCGWEASQKVSIKEIFKWERGKAVTWDRRELHCSDNFTKNNIENKIAVVLFTEKILN